MLTNQIRYYQLKYEGHKIWINLFENTSKFDRKSLYYIFLLIYTPELKPLLSIANSAQITIVALPHLLWSTINVKAKCVSRMPNSSSLLQGINIMDDRNAR